MWSRGAGGPVVRGPSTKEELFGVQVPEKLLLLQEDGAMHETESGRGAQGAASDGHAVSWLG